MSKNILLLALCIIIAGIAEAQKATTTKQAVATTQSESPQQKTKELIRKMSASCSLRPEQVTKLTSAYVEYYTKHDALKKQKDILDKSSYDDRSDAMKKSRDAAIKSTLTAGQYKQWTAAKDKEKKEAKKGKQEE